MTLFQVLFLGILLDFIFGDPDRIWSRTKHPIVYIGTTISWLDGRLNNGAFRRLKGIVTVFALVVIGLLLGKIIKVIPDFRILEVLTIAILVSHKSLIDHVKAVALALPQGLNAARIEVAKIVGRDPNTLDHAGVATAAIESSAENFSDGVVAPIFWFLIFGVPGIIMYKIVNTADSMIGYKSDEYAEFGWAAARFDDVLNWVPSRICAGLMCLVHRDRDAFDLTLNEAPLHASPNAGWPEAAMAGILDIRLAGPRIYDGILTDDAYINSLGRSHLDEGDINDAIGVVNRTWYAMAGLFGFLALLGIIY